MDVDAFVRRHTPEWDRLDVLTQRAGRPRRLSGAEVDELVLLYQRAAAHLSVVRTRSSEPLLVARLSHTVAAARAVVTAQSAPVWGVVRTFLVAGFPAALYRGRRWWLAVGAVFIAVSFAVGYWVSHDPALQAQLGTPDYIKQYVEHDFANYYTEGSASAFTSGVWTNNAFLALLCVLFGVVLGLPVLGALWLNASSVGLAGGVMAAHGKTAIFFGLISPHGMLELTALFVAAATGLRLAWTVVAPGRRSRGLALAQEGRAAIAVAVGLAMVLGVSALLEGFVTPSGLPTVVRIAIGATAEIAFFAYVFLLGRRAAAEGFIGDVDATGVGDVLPEAG
ncbi:MAG: integral rane protein [Frankiales bacterium]|nr:integral rane protein [Frankiales bacterium]